MASCVITIAIANVTESLSTDGAGEVGSTFTEAEPDDFPRFVVSIRRIPALIFRSIGNLGGLGDENLR